MTRDLCICFALRSSALAQLLSIGYVCFAALLSYTVRRGPIYTTSEPHDRESIRSVAFDGAMKVRSWNPEVYKMLLPLPVWARLS